VGRFVDVNEGKSECELCEREGFASSPFFLLSHCRKHVVLRFIARYIRVARCPFVRVLASALRKTGFLQCENLCFFAWFLVNESEEEANTNCGELLPESHTITQPHECRVSIDTKRPRSRMDAAESEAEAGS